MERQGVMFGSQLIEGPLGFSEREFELFQGSLKAICPHTVHENINPEIGQFCLPLDRKPGHS